MRHANQALPGNKVFVPSFAQVFYPSRTVQTTEAQPLIQRRRSAVARIHLQIDRDDAARPRSRQDGRHQCRSHALLPPNGRNIKLLKPGDRANMFHAQNRGDMSDTNDTALRSCQLNETTVLVSDNSLQQSRQGPGRCLNPVLT